MNCRNCGVELKEHEKFCPMCATPVNAQVNEGYSKPDIIVNTETNSNHQNNYNTGYTNSNNMNSYEYYKETENISKQMGSTTILVLSILELLCCNQLFGIIALVLMATKFKPAIDARNFEAAREAKKTINTILIIGLVLGILLNVAYVVLSVLSEL